MERDAITAYVVCEEVTRILGIVDDDQVKMSTPEVMTFAILAARHFNGNYKKTKLISSYNRFFAVQLSESRLCRRVNRIPMQVWMAVLHILAALHKEKTVELEFAVDSFPIQYCEKVRADRRRCFKDRKFLGYAASKKRFFCGVKVHMIVSRSGAPIEMIIAPAAESDLNVLWRMQLDLPSHSKLYADGAYSCHQIEDILHEDEQLILLAKRAKSEVKRKRSPEQQREISSKRQIVETAFSWITDQLPRYFRSRSEKGFLVRIVSLVISYSLKFVQA